MRDAYFGINECTEEELEQLREDIFWNTEKYEDDLSERDLKLIGECSYPDEIGFEILEKAFGMYAFVDEDFWCNC